jgi:hypothetical protein
VKKALAPELVTSLRMCTLTVNADQIMDMHNPRACRPKIIASLPYSPTSSNRIIRDFWFFGKEKLTSELAKVGGLGYDT